MENTVVNTTCNARDSSTLRLRKAVLGPTYANRDASVEALDNALILLEDTPLNGYRLSASGGTVLSLSLDKDLDLLIVNNCNDTIPISGIAQPLPISTPFSYELSLDTIPSTSSITLTSGTTPVNGTITTWNLDQINLVEQQRYILQLTAETISHPGKVALVSRTILSNVTCIAAPTSPMEASISSSLQSSNIISLFIFLLLLKQFCAW